MKARERLRIGTQKSGRLSAAGQDLLARCGLHFRHSRDRLFCFGENQPIDLLLVRDDDIPGLIIDGSCDLGIVGRNVLQEYVLEHGQQNQLREVSALGFGHCRLSLAIPQSQTWQGVKQLQGQRIATSYPRILQRWLNDEGIAADIVMLAGSVEIAPRLGTADLICDLVQSGSTLAANQLQEVATVMQSEAVLVGHNELPKDERGDILSLLLSRIESALNVRETRFVTLRAPRQHLDAIKALLPGCDHPILTAIEGQEDTLAIQAICNARVDWQELEALAEAGAQSIVVLPVEKMLA